MSAQATPVTGLSINLHRGIVGLIEHAAAKIPHGREVWEAGLGDVVAQAVKDIGVSTEELTAVEAARQIGILKGGKKRRRL